MRVFTLPDGSIIRGWGQFQIGDQKYPHDWLLRAPPEDIDGLGITHVDEADPEAPPPVKMARTSGLIRIAVVSGIVTDATIYYMDIASVLRVSAGRYRFYNVSPDVNDELLPGVDIMDAAVRSARISAKTPAYTEVRVIDGAGVAADASKITLRLDRIVTQ